MAHEPRIEDLIRVCNSHYTITHQDVLKKTMQAALTTRWSALPSRGLNHHHNVDGPTPLPSELLAQAAAPPPCPSRLSPAPT